MSDTIALTIVICTYNRAALLDKVLKSMERQSARERWELLVVDNNSSDSTKSVVDGYAGRVPMRYVFEGRQGTSRARNAGIRSARGEYIGFIDDDSIAAPDWVEVALTTMRAVHPAIFGGQYIPYYTTPKPVWFKDAYEVRKLSEEACWLPPGKYLSGSNLFFKKDLFGLIGMFDDALGPHGDDFALGEETQLQVSADAHSIPRYFTPALKIYNLVPPWKMSLTYRFKRKLLAGYAQARVHRHQRPSLLRDIGGFAYSLVKMTHRLCMLPLRDRRNYPYWQQYLFERVLPYATYWGRLCVWIRRNSASS